MIHIFLKAVIIKKTFIIWTLFIISSVSIQAQEQAEAKQCISLVLSGSVSRPFWSNIINGAIDASEQLGYKVHVRGTINDDDSSGQLQILKSFEQRYQCRGVVIAPSNQNINPYVSQLKKLNIPTVYIDRDTGGERAATVKTDNYAAGILAAQKLSEALGGQGKVILFRLKKGVASTDARESGFIDEAKRKGLEIIAAPYIGTRVGEARKNTRSTLLKFKNVDGIFTPNDTTTIGTIIVRDSMDIHKDVIHIGFDDTPFIANSFKEGKLQGYLSQSPYQMGYQGIYTVDKAIHNELTDENISTQVIYISKSP